MTNFFMMETTMKERQRELLEEAKARRLAAQAGRRPALAPLFVRFGRGFVKVGNWLENRYTIEEEEENCSICGKALPSRS